MNEVDSGQAGPIIIWPDADHQAGQVVHACEWLLTVEPLALDGVIVERQESLAGFLEKEVGLPGHKKQVTLVRREFLDAEPGDPLTESNGRRHLEYGGPAAAIPPGVGLCIEVEPSLIAGGEDFRE